MSSKWREVSFGEAFLVNPTRPLQRGASAWHIAMENISSFSRPVSVVGTKVYSGSGSKFRNGDTLLARITPCLENGKTAFVASLAKDEVGHGSTEFIVISGRPEISDDLFAYYVAISSEFRKYAIGQMSGTSGRQRVPNEAVKRYVLNLPPLPEQKAIARILGSLDDKIELNRQMNATLEALAQTLFRAWFVDFEPVKAKAAGLQPAAMEAETAALFPSEFEESALGLIPKGWKWQRLEEAFEINPTRRFPSSTYLDMSNVPTRGHRPQGWTQREAGSGMKFINGDTLLARITPCLENGKTAFVDFLKSGEVAWGSTEFVVLRPRR